MNRRGLLASLGGALVGAAGTAGCLARRDETGPRHPPSSPEGSDGGGATGRKLSIVDYTVAEGDDGSLTVPVTVENAAEERRTGTLVGVATVGDETYRAERQVSVAGGTEAEATLVFDVAYAKFVENGSLSLDWKGS